MSRIEVDHELCLQDGACVEVCPARTLRLTDSNYPEELPEAPCIECGHCVAVCQCGAIHHTSLPDASFLQPLTAWPSADEMDALLMGRRSVREFKTEPLPHQTMEALLEIARRAPSASNKQQLHWIVMNGREKLAKLAGLVVEGGKKGGLAPSLVAQWEGGYDFVLRGAPTVVVACAPANYSWGKEDAAIALTFLELAAEARGIGVCWAGYLSRIGSAYPPVQQWLEIPDDYTILGGLMLGEGKYAYHRVPPRKPLSVHWVE